MLLDAANSSGDEKPWYHVWPDKIPKHISYPQNSLGELLGTSAAKHPNRTALVYFDNRISYGDLDRLANRFARGLTGLGVKKGDRVALYLPNTPPFIVAFYGAIRCGAIVTSLNLLEGGSDIEHQLVDSGAETIVALDLFYPTLSGVIDRTCLKRMIVTGLRDFMPASKSFLGTLLGKIPFQPIEPRANQYSFRDLVNRNDGAEYSVEIDPDEDVAVLQYTGGTTGTPKGAMLTHMNLISNTVMCLKWLGTESDESYLSILPFFHIYGLMTGLLAPLYIGAKVVVYPKFDPEQVLRAIEKYRIQVFCGVPTMYDKLLRDPSIREHDYSSLRFCMSGSDTLRPELKESYEEVFGSTIIEGYGLSEASPITHSNPL
jgi:long-chain acyl-CoA synthetase